MNIPSPWIAGEHRRFDLRTWPRAAARWPGSRRARGIVGGFFLTMGGVHLGIVAADPQLYEHFADAAPFAFVRDGWQEIVMARPELFGLLLMAGEVALGTALLVGGRAARIGWIGVITFHLLLLLFGWWAWVWAVPALAVIVPLALTDLMPLDGPRSLDGDRRTEDTSDRSGTAAVARSHSSDA
jgi:hypothetical protein